MSSRDLVVSAAGSAGAAKDDYFKNVSLLLSGDGTNGAQNNTFLAANGAAQGPFADPAGYWSNYFSTAGSTYLNFTDSSNVCDLGNASASFEAWVYLTASTSVIINKSGGVADYNTTNGIEYTIASVSGVFTMYYNTGGTYGTLASGSASALNTWHHVVVASNATTLSMYVDGTRVATATAGITKPTTRTTIRVANDLGGTGLVGYISNLRIISGSNAYDPSQSTITVPTAPLTAISGTSLLTCQSNVICDTSSNKFAITANGNAAVNTKSPFTISEAYNPYSFSGYFDGTGDYLSVPSNAALSLGLSDFTIEFWINTTQTGYKTGVSKWQSGQFSWMVRSNDDGDGKWQFFYSTNGSNYTQIAGSSITDGAWHHIAVSRSGSNIRLFTDGVLNATNTSNPTIYDSTASVVIGSDQGSNNLLGYISNLRIVKGTALYTSNFTPANEPLTAISDTSLLTCQSSTFVDNSPNNFTITVNGNTTVATAAYNPAMPITRNGNTTQGTFSPYGSLWSNYFDGTGDYLTPPDNTAFQFGTGDFTLEAWINPDALLDYAGVISQLYSTANTQWSFCIMADGSLNFTSWYAALRSPAGLITKGQWYHVVATRGSGTASLFINGTRVATEANTKDWSTTLAARIGYSGAAGDNYFKGYISNARVVKGSAVYNPSSSTITVPTTPLTAVSGTSLLTCQSNRFRDNSSNNFTLTVNGNTSVQRFSPFNPTAPYSAATIGGSGYFDGSGDYLTAPNNAANQLGSGNFTIQFWAYFTTVVSSGVATLLAKRANGSSVSDFTFATVNGVMGFYASTNTSSWDLSSGGNLGSPVAGQWYHYTAVRSGSNVSVYVNGVRTGNGNFGSSSLTNSANAVSIGGDQGSQYFTGYIEDVQIVKGTAVYDPAQTTITIPTAPPTAVTNTSLLLNFTNAGIPDAAMMNDLETVGNAQVSTSVKKYGTGSLAFDGTGDWLQLPITPQLYLGTTYTIEAWIYPSTVSDWQPVFSMTEAFTGGFTELGIYRNGTAIRASLRTATSGAVTIIEAGTVSTNTWYHVALSVNATSAKLFLNGTQIGSTTTFAEYPIAKTTYAAVGAWGNGFTAAGYGPWNGYIDDLRITKGYARYTANFTPPTAALPVY